MQDCAGQDIPPVRHRTPPCKDNYKLTEKVGEFSKKKLPHLVKLLVKLAELGDFLHDLFPHEEGRVQHGVLLAVEDPQGVIDKSLLQEHQRALNATQERKAA